MMNIVLVGFMGTGKTVVAKALARELDRDYVSIDDMIIEHEGRSINSIFADKGEAYFRNVEKEIVKEVSVRDGQVIDAGGGVVLDAENMSNLRTNGTIICLWADPAKVRERTMRRGHRPLLNIKDPDKRIEELLESRRPYYEKADHHIDTDGLDVWGVVTEAKKIVGVL